MKSFHSLFVWLVLTSLLQAQVVLSQTTEESTNQFSILYGYSFYNTYEPILSSVRQSSQLLSSGLAYTRENKNGNEFGIRFLFLNKSDLTSRLSNSAFRAPNTGEIFGGSIEYFYRKLINKASIDIYLGLHLNGFYFDKSLDVIAFDDARAADLFVDLGPSVSVVKSLGKHSIKADLGLPLVGYVAAKTRNSETFPFDLIARDKNIATAIQYGDIALINNYFNMNFNAVYAYQITQNISIGLQYGFQYYDYKKEIPFNVQAVSYRCLLQAKYQF